MSLYLKRWSLFKLSIQQLRMGDSDFLRSVLDLVHVRILVSEKDKKSIILEKSSQSRKLTFVS